MSPLIWTYRSLRTTCSFAQEQVVYRLCRRQLSTSPSILFFFLFAIFLSGCCSRPSPHDNSVQYFAEALEDSPQLQPPSFQILSGNQSFNKIGTPVAVDVKGEPHLQVAPNPASLYIQQQTFTTEKGRYTNQIHRLHFPEVPLSLCKINITAGNNPGLLIIYTSDNADRLVLITTVHTCGCYLAFFPTDLLPEESLPQRWPERTQRIYGYDLPSIIPSLTHSKQAYTFTLASETHRVIGVSKHNIPSAQADKYRYLHLRPMAELNRLPYQEKTVSFFETKGSRTGYVKNSSKPLERLLISWWAFDWHVGEDKAYGTMFSKTTPFYTSLKFWHRWNSDMNNFPRFLNYWGWRL